MRRMAKSLEKSWILNKRFLKKHAFLFLLAVIPFLMIAMRLAFAGQSSILRVELCTEEVSKANVSNGDVTAHIIHDLMHLDGIVHYQEVSSREEAEEHVRTGKVDCAIVFPADIEKLLSNYRGSSLDSKIVFFTRLDTTSLRLMREQVYGALYSYIAPDYLIAFMNDHDNFSGLSDQERDNVLNTHYKHWKLDENLFQLRYSDNKVIETKSSLITAPFRGMLSVFLLMTGFAASLFFIEDEKRGAFIWVRPERMGWFELLYTMIPIIDVGIIGLISLKLLGYFTNLTLEILNMILFVLAITGFVTICRKLLRRESMLGTAAVLFAMLSLAFCPVFIASSRFLFLQRILPPFFYLNSLHSFQMTCDLLCYAVISCGVSVLLSVIWKG